MQEKSLKMRTVFLNVVRTKFNNGIKYRATETKKMIPSLKGVILFGAENASFFYQKDEIR